MYFILEALEQEGAICSRSLITTEISPTCFDVNGYNVIGCTEESLLNSHTAFILHRSFTSYGCS